MKTMEMNEMKNAVIVFFNTVRNMFTSRLYGRGVVIGGLPPKLHAPKIRQVEPSPMTHAMNQLLDD